jgi:hypothetical protein
LLESKDIADQPACCSGDENSVRLRLCLQMGSEIGRLTDGRFCYGQRVVPDSAEDNEAGRDADPSPDGRFAAVVQALQIPSDA